MLRGLSILVNIEIHRYIAVMPRTRKSAPSDPDVRLLAALADPTRLAIVRQLATETETCACDFTSCCDVGQPTVSHHLRVLREAGVVTSERRGQWIFYRLAPDAAERLTGIARGLIPGGLFPVGDLVGPPGSAATAGRAGDCLSDAAQRSFRASGGSSQRSVPPPSRNGRSVSILASAPLRMVTPAAPQSTDRSSLKSGS
jgi:ArsR family transcriptional regulator, arsenate/arsenite/antimonite-responsive transcriptional repressor